MSRTASRKRTKRGYGRLYKRTPNGVEHPAGSRARGAYWLEYRVRTQAGNRIRKREPLKRPDGTPITDLQEARTEQERITAPYRTGREVDHLAAIRRQLLDAQERDKRAAEEATPPPLLAQAWPLYQKSRLRPRSGPHTLSDYERHLRKFLEWLGGQYPNVKHIGEVTSDIAAAYAAVIDPDVGTQGYSPNTYNKRIAFLKLLYRVMVQEQRTNQNPFERIPSIKNLAGRTNSRRELTVEQVYTLLSSATGELALLLGLGYFTGLRRGDCSTLRWSEVDLARGIITRIPNKIRSRKNKPVKIGIHHQLLAALAAAPPAQRTGYVLPTIAKLYSDPARRDRLNRMITDHFRKCGIDPQREGTGEQRDPETGKTIRTGRRAVTDYGFHSLRYSYVSHHAEAGTPQGVIQANAGHSNPAMTAHYTRISDAAARQYAEALVLPDPGDSTPRKETRMQPDPLPGWARELVLQLGPENWREVRETLLQEGQPGRKPDPG